MVSTLAKYFCIQLLILFFKKINSVCYRTIIVLEGLKQMLFFSILTLEKIDSPGKTNLVLICPCRAWQKWRTAVSCYAICSLWGFLPEFGGCRCIFLSLARLLAPVVFSCNLQLLQDWMLYPHLWWQLSCAHVRCKPPLSLAQGNSS